MLKKPIFTSLLSLCEKEHVEKLSFKKGDIVIDYESNHSLYVFKTGWYSVWSISPFGGLHEVGEIVAPSTLGEGIFFGSFKKPVRVITEFDGEVYVLEEKVIAKMAKSNSGFYELIMRACLSTTNERIRESNIERTIRYALIDALEAHTFGNIPMLLGNLKKTFDLVDILWIERHEVLTDLFALKYQESAGALPINEKIDMKRYKKYEAVKGFPHVDKYGHIFPLISRGNCYGYMVYVLPEEYMPGYIRRITNDMIPNCIRIIEEGWKKGKM